MAGMAGAGAGMNMMGATLGGIGDIISAFSYKRPKLPEPGGQEKRLRALANAQLIGGGQQLLAGQNLYNQMSPFLLGQLPGMRLTPTGGGGAAGGVGDGGVAGGGAASPGMASYQQALADYQAAVGRNQRLQQLDTALKAAKKGPEKQALRQEKKALTRAKKGSPDVTQLERAMYQAGSTPPTVNVTGATEPSGDWGMSPSLQSSLAQIMGFIQGARGGGGAGGSTVQGPASSFLDRYTGAGGTL